MELIETIISSSETIKASKVMLRAYLIVGASGVVLLAESHISFHTWPEFGLITIDLFTCGDPGKADVAFEYIREALQPTEIDFVKKKRGEKTPEPMLVPQGQEA